MTAPFIPEGAPFSEDQRAWLAGFFAGLNSRVAMQGQISAASGANAQAVGLDILFGTQTGNAEAVAEDAAAAARGQGFAPKVTGLDDVLMDDLVRMEQAIIVISTYGEGEMPDNAQLFWDVLSSGMAPRLEQLSYSVLALGDTSYDEFCHAGKLVDMRLEQLGARRLNARIDCDVDYEDPAAEWIDATLPLIADLTGALADGVAAPDVGTGDTGKPKWNRRNPFSSPTIKNRLLSGKGSAKEIRHFAFSLAESGLTYEAGDAAGIIPKNSPALVELFLERLGASRDTAVKGLDMPLGEALRSKFEIVTPSKEFIAAIAERTWHDELSNVVANGDKEAIESFMWGRDTLDLLNLDDKLALSVEDFVGLLKPLQHRAYSISSSPKAHQGEVHLTVAAIRWDAEGREHRGVCSTFMADELSEGAPVGLFMSPNKAFRLPEDDDVPIIMIGPGTGVAPFRAFLEERRERGAKGRNWLFFGDQHRAEDFIYEDEISAMSADGLLTRLDLAFSRDQKEKIYVQSRMRENGKALFSWLQDGACLYVCGDATRMAKDVDAALNELIAEYGDFSADEAAEYMANLKREKRYLRDVY